MFGCGYRHDGDNIKHEKPKINAQKLLKEIKRTGITVQNICKLYIAQNKKISNYYEQQFKNEFDVCK